MEIYVLDKQLNTLGIFSSYDSILWTSKFHEPGTFKAVFLFTEKMNSILQRGNLIYKTDELEAAVITRKYLKLNKFGEQTIQIQGYMTSRYLQKRIIWSKMTLQGRPEQIMRQMVSEQAVNPTDSDRKIPNLELGLNISTDIEIEKQVEFDNLQSTLTELSKAYEIGYRLRINIAEKKFYFDLYQGTNRTKGTENPCVFSRDFNNILTQQYQEDDTNYRNVCLVGGCGEDSNRIMTTVGDFIGIDRNEFFMNASSLSNKDVTVQVYLEQLKEKGKEKLASFMVSETFESKINQQKAMTYNLGDYVTCTDSVWNLTKDTQIKAIEKGYSKTERSVVCTFGDDVPTLISLIKAEKE